MQWLTQASGWLIVGAVASLMLSIGGLFAARWFVVTLPADYFVEKAEPAAFARQHPLARWSWFVAKNALGIVLIVAGVAMLVAPGPGALTILAGLCLMSFPGKRALTLRLLASRHVLSGMNMMRARAGAPPLETLGRAAGEPGEH